jgi:hypothetical protein
MRDLFHSGFLLGLFFYPEDGGDMFLRNVGKLSSDYLLHAGFFLGLFFDPEVGSDMFLRNAGRVSTDHTALCPIK